MSRVSWFFWIYHTRRRDQWIYKNEHVWWLCAGADCRCISRRGPDARWTRQKKPIIYSQHFPTSCLLLPSLRLPVVVPYMTPDGCYIVFFSDNGACRYTQRRLSFDANLQRITKINNVLVIRHKMYLCNYC